MWQDLWEIRQEKDFTVMSPWWLQEMWCRCALVCLMAGKVSFLSLMLHTGSTDDCGTQVLKPWGQWSNSGNLSWSWKMSQMLVPIVWYVDRICRILTHKAGACISNKGKGPSGYVADRLHGTTSKCSGVSYALTVVDMAIGLLFAWSCVAADQKHTI